MRVECDPWFPLHWSRAHGYEPVPFIVWLAWHAAHRMPQGDA
jgi:hypothetical protein